MDKVIKYSKEIFSKTIFILEFIIAIIFAKFVQEFTTVLQHYRSCTS